MTYLTYIIVKATVMVRVRRVTRSRLRPEPGSTLTPGGGGETGGLTNKRILYEIKVEHLKNIF